MKEKIIAQMHEAVRDMGSAQDERGYLLVDFKVILQDLEGYDGPFIFAIRNSGANLVKLSVGERVKEMRDNQYWRYYHINNVDDPYFNCIESKYYFLYERGAESLKLIDHQTAKQLFVKAEQESVAAFKTLYPELKIVERKSPDVHFLNFKAVMEQIRYAQSIGDETMLDCIRRFRWRGRYNDDHYIEVMVEDAERHILYFEEYYQGKYSGNGGIVPHYDKHGRATWSVHT